jgi:CopG family transcriptional regulator, nickel-responsive regulator
MAIISVSLDDKQVSELDALVEEFGYKGRSDAVRTALKAMFKEDRKHQTTGKMSGVMLLVHDEEHEQAFSDARHRFESLIKTLIHNQLGNGKCLEVFVLEGESEEMEELMRTCRRSGKAEYIKIVKA